MFTLVSSGIPGALGLLGCCACLLAACLHALQPLAGLDTVESFYAGQCNGHRRLLGLFMPDPPFALPLWLRAGCCVGHDAAPVPSMARVQTYWNGIPLA